VDNFEKGAILGDFKAILAVKVNHDHKWKFIKSYCRTPSRSINSTCKPVFSLETFNMYTVYECTKCGARAKKYPTLDLKLEDPSNEGLSCDNVFIKSIIS
jgi:hypothetical protein